MYQAPISAQPNLRGQNILIVGGSGGIGACTAKAFAREGSNVLIADIGDGSILAEQLEGPSNNSFYIPCDVEDEQSVRAAIETAIEAVGQIHVLVYCAGICDATDLYTLSRTEWDKEINVNLRGAFFVLREVIPHMKQKMYGKIVCIGSIAGKMGGVLAGPHYAASKGGLHALVKSTAKAVASFGIYVNAIAPGPVNTNMIAGQPYSPVGIPLGRLGEPEDVAEVVLFLSSQASNWITGTVLDVNGGILMD